jgi:hypothetical protein
VRKEIYTLIGGPLMGDAAPFIEEMTIRRLLRNTKPVKGWTLEVPQFAPEHALTTQPPFYDGTSFDDLSIISPHPLLFEEMIISWGKLTVFYSLFEVANVMQWHKWIWNDQSVDFVFRQYEQGVVQKIWIFNGIECHDISVDKDNHYDTFLECKFSSFQQTLPIFQ